MNVQNCGSESEQADFNVKRVRKKHKGMQVFFDESRSVETLFFIPDLLHVHECM